VGLVVVTAAFGWSVAKGLVFVAHLDELYFWLNTYAGGYVRRGLVGTLLSPVTALMPGEAILHGLFGLHIVLLAVFGLLVFRLAKDGSNAAWPSDRLLSVVLLASSPFFGQLTHHAGYPDTLIAVVLCCAAIRLRHARGAEVALLLVASCCFHELCFLLLVPMAAFSLALRRGTRWRDGGLVVASVILAAVLTLAAQAPGAALVHALERVGFSPEAAHAQIAEALSRSLGAWLVMLVVLWRDNMLNAGIGLVYACVPPGLILVLGAPRVGRAIMRRTEHLLARRALWALYVASGFGAVLLLAIAIDLSRIASFTTLMAFLTVTLIPFEAPAQVAEPAREGWRLPAVCAAVVVAYTLMPVFDLHFGFGRVVNLARVGFVCPPCAGAGRTLLGYYDRGLPAATVQQIETDPALGNR
jgi:hypothetical protein